MPGTLAGLLAAVMIAALAGGCGWISRSDVSVVAAAGFLGTIIDSLLGATLERRGMIDNNGVNFISTIAASLVAFVFRHFAR